MLGNLHVYRRLQPVIHRLKAAVQGRYAAVQVYIQKYTTKPQNEAFPFRLRLTDRCDTQ
jgi:hypothetical protein